MSRWQQHHTGAAEFQGRQLDRQYPKSKPPTTEELRHMLRGIRWNYFNNCQVRKVGDIRFACGIGIHMNRMTAAVTSHARFLALKVVPEEVVIEIKRVANWEPFGLIKVLYIENIRPRVIGPTRLTQDSVTINYIEDTPMWDELIIPNDGI